MPHLELRMNFGPLRKRTELLHVGIDPPLPAQPPVEEPGPRSWLLAGGLRALGLLAAAGAPA